MDLTFDDATEEFRIEVRDFLAANKAHIPTVSYDLAKGFEQHRQWDRVLFDAGLSVIAWPREYGGREPESRMTISSRQDAAIAGSATAAPAGTAGAPVNDYPNASVRRLAG